MFVPQVPYSGSLKSHLAALARASCSSRRAPSRSPRSSSISPTSRALVRPRAAGVGAAGGARRGPLRGLQPGVRHPLQPEQRRQLRRGAGARHLGALARGARHARGRASDRGWPSPPGLLLGLAFWCHILAVIYLAAARACCSSRSGASRRGARSLALASGFGLGYGPGWLWNLANDWDSFHYLLPGAARSVGTGDAGEASRRGLRLEALAPAHRPRAGPDGLRHRLRPRRRPRAARCWPGSASLAGDRSPRRRPRGAPCARGRGRSPCCCSSARRTSPWCWSRCRTCRATRATCCS